ncbi:hypothetical protein A5672_01905 [Mycobacterium alsense]|uniref:PPE family protein n=1 Tax=Mycobacterium alsense TaxID=324058 RepID=A0ABD6NVI3_9MYCO|nr:PPE family protein [Mycobacterium alsense]OBG30577.1 hypothetical protein A5672_01905 [Mycobacterium alsense]
MVFDFAALPPEINSALMYTGAGSGPLMAAAASWNGLAAELSTTATQWESIIATLTGEQWTGAGSASAAAAAQPYIEWLATTAAAAEQAAAQATASAAAYEAAFAGTVPPPVIAANRAQLAALVATNFLGINTPAIMATEALYAEMWVQDAVTMYTYSAAAMASSALQPLTPAAPTTNPAAGLIQPAATTAAATANPAEDALSMLAGDFGTGAFGDNLWAALSTSYPELAGLISAANADFGTGFIFNGIQQFGVTAAWFVGAAIPTAVSYVHTAATAAAAPAAAAASEVAPAAGVEGAFVNSVSGGAVSGALGESAAVGASSVPASWASATPATTVGATAAEGSGWAVAAEEANAGAPLIGAPGGMAAAAKGAGAYGSGPRYGFKPIVMPKQVVV